MNEVKLLGVIVSYDLKWHKSSEDNWAKVVNFQKISSSYVVIKAYIYNI